MLEPKRHESVRRYSRTAAGNDALAFKSQLVCGSQGQVQNATCDERTSIRDPDVQKLAILLVLHGYYRIERQSLVCSSH